MYLLLWVPPILGALACTMADRAEGLSEKVKDWLIIGLNVVVYVYVVVMFGWIHPL